MTAIRAVFMCCVMTASYRITAIRVFLTDLQYMLINVIAMRMVKMAIVQIISMITVSDCRMTAAFPVLVCSSLHEDIVLLILLDRDM